MDKQTVAHIQNGTPHSNEKEQELTSRAAWMSLKCLMSVKEARHKRLPRHTQHHWWPRCQNLPSWASRIPLTMMPFRPIHAVACIRMSFLFKAEYYSIVWLERGLCIRGTVYGFHVWLHEWRRYTHRCTCVCHVPEIHSLGYIPTVASVGHVVILVLVLWRGCSSISHPTDGTQGSSFSTCSPTPAVPHVGFVCMAATLMGRGCFCCSCGLLVIWGSSWRNACSGLCPFFNRRVGPYKVSTDQILSP
jgi:hypothetical protein